MLKYLEKSLSERASSLAFAHSERLDIRNRRSVLDERWQAIEKHIPPSMREDGGLYEVAINEGASIDEDQRDFIYWHAWLDGLTVGVTAASRG